MTDFIRFTEVNDWEGETWNFWLQIDGNEEQIDRLAWKLKGLADEQVSEFPYTLDVHAITSEDTVDALVRYAEDGYIPSHNKVTGKFICPDSLGPYADGFYKGGISEFFD